MSIEDGSRAVPWFGVRKLARSLLSEVATLKSECEHLRGQLATIGALSVVELENRRLSLERDVEELAGRLGKERADAAEALRATLEQVSAARRDIVATEDLVLLQEVGIYRYRHPLTDAVAFQNELKRIDERIAAMVKTDGGAVMATTNWTVNGSVTEGRKMVRDFSKLMLRAFNAEADNLVRGLKPYKLDSAIDRLRKVADTIQRLGKTMQIRISSPYFQLRVRELELTADFLQKQAEEKEAERAERERLREERRVQQEIEKERARLEKERQHFFNALQALIANGDEAGAGRLREQLGDVQRAIEDIDYRAANIRAGYGATLESCGTALAPRFWGERVTRASGGVR